MRPRAFGVLAAMVALLAAGLSTGTRIYYALCLLLALMLGYALLSIAVVLRTIRLRLTGARPDLLRGEQLTTILRVQQRSPLPVGEVWLELHVPGGASGRQELRLRLPPCSRRSFRNVIRCAHRGVYELGVARIGAVDSFGLFEFSRKAGMKMLRVEVRPRPMELEAMPLQPVDLGSAFHSRATEDASSPSDVRNWQEGDELKRVHWKLTLRKRELMVRTFEESARPDTLLIPDLGKPAALPELQASLEDAICEATLGAIRAQLAAGFPVRLVLQSGAPTELEGRSIAELGDFAAALMRVRFDSDRAYEQTLTLVFGRMQRTGAVVLATSRLSGRTADLALRLLRLGIGLRLLWVSAEESGEESELLERLRMAGARVERIELPPEEPNSPGRPDPADGPVDDVFEV